MTRKYWLHLSPSLLVASGIIVGSLVAVRTDQTGWMALAGPLVLALAVVSADIVNSRLRGKSSGPSAASLLLAGGFMLASSILASSNPGVVKTLIPIMGAGSWAVLLLPSDKRETCRVSLR